MGKNKGARRNANVFKVSTVRSNKLKAKAKKVVSNLKKVSDGQLRINKRIVKLQFVCIVS